MSAGRCPLCAGTGERASEEGSAEDEEEYKEEDANKPDTDPSGLCMKRIDQSQHTMCGVTCCYRWMWLETTLQTGPDQKPLEMKCTRMSSTS